MIRLKEESKLYDSSIFVTLTYSEEELPWASRYPTLAKYDLQQFIKNLRYRSGKELKDVRYYALGEYGPKTKRPHYHLIIFNHSSNDYDNLSKAWKKGNIVVSDLNDRRIGYITKYHINKGNYPKGCQPSFTTMSLKPPIGYSYISKMYDYHRRGIQTAFYQDNDVKRSLPRYYRLKLFSENERLQMKEKLADDFAVKVMEKFHVEHPKENYFRVKQSTYVAIQARYERLKKINNKL